MDCYPTRVTLYNFIHPVTGFSQTSRTNWTPHCNLKWMQVVYYNNFVICTGQLNLANLAYLFSLFLMSVFH